MGLMNKLKNILFEEEEVEIPVIDKKDKKEIKKVEEVSKPVYNSLVDDEELLDFTPKKTEKEIPVIKNEVPKNEKSFSFPAFDEEEFKSVVPKRPVNNIEIERAKEPKKNYRYEPKIEPKKEEKPKFKPSPIISPVYGILDKNYTPDEITSRKSVTSEKNLDVDSVRKKAFGIVDNKNKDKKVADFVENIIKDEKESEEKVLQEKMEKSRTIDELLKDSSDDYIELHDEKIENKNDIDDLMVPDEAHEKKLDALDIEPKKEQDEEEELESDLFDLIDSMYENREDGE